MNRNNWIAFAIAVAVTTASGRLACGAPINVDGIVRYQGAIGNEADDAMNGLDFFPLRGSRVEIWDENTTGHSLITSTYTADDGSYSFRIDDAETSHGAPGVLDTGTADLFIRVYSLSRPQTPAAGGIDTAYRVTTSG